MQMRSFSYNVRYKRLKKMDMTLRSALPTLRVLKGNSRSRTKISFSLSEGPLFASLANASTNVRTRLRAWNFSVFHRGSSVIRDNCRYTAASFLLFLRIPRASCMSRAHFLETTIFRYTIPRYLAPRARERRRIGKSAAVRYTRG